MNITFGTGNKSKLAEAQFILKGYNIVGTQLEIEEIQSLDPIKVATQKARDYYSIINSALFIEDVSLTFEALNQLPGTYIDGFMKSLGNEGILKLIENQTNRNALALITLVYIDNSKQEHIFQAEMKGTVSNEERGSNGFGWDTVFIPAESDKTLAELTLDEKNQYSMRAQVLEKFNLYLKSL